MVRDGRSLFAGKRVLVVNGAYRGSEASLTEIDEKRFCCSIKIETVRETCLCINGRVEWQIWGHRSTVI